MGPEGRSPSLLKVNLIMNKLKGNVSYYFNIKDTTSQIFVGFDAVLNVIKTDTYLKEKTAEIRSLRLTNPDLYKILKKQYLPMVCASGEFSYRDSNISNLKSYSNILILDFDFDVPERSVIDEFKMKLIYYATALNIYAIWESPGSGIKAAMIHSNTHPEYHSELVEQVKHSLYPNTPMFDMNCKDLSRSCFLSYDSNLYINPDPNLIEFQFYHNPDYTPSVNTKRQQNQRCVGHTSAFVHTDKELADHSIWEKFCDDKKLMNMLIRDFNSNTPDYYQDGHRHEEVKRRATLYCKDGVLFDNAVWSLVGQFGPNSRAGLDELGIKQMVSSCYNKARGEFGNGRWAYLSKKKH
jgi:hypothetical protein